MKKLFIFCIVIALMVLGFYSMDNSATVFADDIVEPYQYEIEFDNGTVFMMYAGDDLVNSGLYQNDESHAKIYLLENPTYFYQYELVFSVDGLHFAHLPWTTYDYSTGEGGVAVAFYSNGCLTKQYFLHEVITNMSVLEPSASHVVWENVSKRVFNTEDNSLTLAAKDGTKTGFYIDSGEMSFRDPGTGFPCSFCGGSDWGKYWCRHNGYLGFKIIGGIIGCILFTLAAVFVVLKIKKKRA